MSKFRPNSLRNKSFHMLTLNNPFWSDWMTCSKPAYGTIFFGTNLDEIWTWFLTCLSRHHKFVNEAHNYLWYAKDGCMSCIHVVDWNKTVLYKPWKLAPKKLNGQDAYTSCCLFLIKFFIYRKWCRVNIRAGYPRYTASGMLQNVP